MSDGPIYPKGVGRIVNAYVESVAACAVAAATGTTYDKAAHAEAAKAFDGLMGQLVEDSDLMDLLCDWCSDTELVIARAKEPGVREDKEGTRDRLWVNHFEGGGFEYETLRDALRDVPRTTQVKP